MKGVDKKPYLVVPEDTSMGSEGHGGMEALKAKFLKVYANLPSDEQEEIVVIVDNTPCSWKKAHDEIKAGTTLGDKMLTELHRLGLL